MMIDGRQIEFRETGTGGPVIFWIMFPFRDNETDHLWECLKEALPDQPFALVICPVKDWNRDLSPWAAPAIAENGEPFEGQGAVTLKWLEEECVPAVMEKGSHGNARNKILAGYSLAGLFTLWEAYEKGTFDGYVCCSGSLWFKNWEQYVKRNSIHSDCSIYLSLGGKEEKTSNPVMAAIGKATKQQEMLLKADPHVKEVTFEMNPGGHFADSGKRLAKGIRRITKALQVPTD